MGFVLVIAKDDRVWVQGRPPLVPNELYTVWQGGLSVILQPQGDAPVVTLCDPTGKTLAQVTITTEGTYYLSRRYAARLEVLQEPPPELAKLVGEALQPLNERQGAPTVTLKFRVINGVELAMYNTTSSANRSNYSTDGRWVVLPTSASHGRRYRSRQGTFLVRAKRDASNRITDVHVNVCEHYNAEALRETLRRLQ